MTHFHTFAAATGALCIAIGAAADITNISQGTTHPTIQDAIDNAVDFDEIVVDPGEYFENLDMLGKPITLRSQDPTDRATVVSTIINGGGAGEVIFCESGETADTIIDGFVITGGNANFGGGMYINGGNPTVMNCSIVNNAAITGGGMFLYNSTSTVTNCTFSGNSADVGGGLYATEDNPTVTSCSFTHNSAVSTGGGAWVSSPASLTLTDAVVCSNTPNQIDGDYTDNGGNIIGLYIPPPATRTNSCPEDIDGDGVVDQADLGALLALYGQTCP